MTQRAILVVVALAAGAARQQPVFKTGVDAVRVDVLATNGLQPLVGLTAEDFELRDSGVRQQIQAVSLEEVPLHLLLALDTSSSVRGEPLKHLKEAAHAAVASLRPTDRAALIAFSHVIQLQIPFTADTAAIARAIDAVEANGSTALCDAVFGALATREAVDGRTLVLLFTDGLDTTSWLSPLTVIEEARRSDVVVDAVRLDSEADQMIDFRRRSRLPPPPPGQTRRWFLEEPQLFRHEFLSALTDETGGQLIVAGSSGSLRDVFVKIVSEFKTRYVLTYSPTNVAPSGWHPIEVRLKNKKGDVRARRGYTR